MKFFAIILSIYLTSLTCIPCSDVVVDTQDNTIASIAMADDHSSSDHDVDLCSPFCTCQCCHIEIITSTHLDFSFVNNDSPQETPTYFESISKDHSCSLLQPPQA
ncbi:hypothetical protein ES677_10265 [Bizionia gelidisalsuginis]|uniref:Uncharacterized protein n=2 Tax=Bizionia TaxID=283785 RepID=A0A8H2QKP5_9FLAO|nr:MULTISPECIES: DUF6660 family protein [Bizionia]TYB71807.1 hypothetical protein ES676_12405 [Bizionia saleffrena]TYC11290.1 hypothetical protein ES677_10265 [Bizionia gelidisalsuginis]